MDGHATAATNLAFPKDHFAMCTTFPKTSPTIPRGGRTSTISGMSSESNQVHIRHAPLVDEHHKTQMRAPEPPAKNKQLDRQPVDAPCPAARTWGKKLNRDRSEAASGTHLTHHAKAGRWAPRVVHRLAVHGLDLQDAEAHCGKCPKVTC